MAKALQFMSDNYDKVMQVNNELKRELSTLTHKYTKLSHDIEHLKSNINTQVQTNIRSNVVVRGIDGEENATAAILKIAQISEINLTPDDFSGAKQILKDGKAPSIIATFKTLDKKKQLVSAAKKKRISTTMYGYNGEQKPIFVDEQLTKESFGLFKEAKKLKSIGVQFVWIANGNILIRERTGMPATRITSMAQLNSIEQNIIFARDRQNITNGVKVTGTSSSALNEQPERMRPPMARHAKIGVNVPAPPQANARTASTHVARPTLQHNGLWSSSDDSVEFVDTETM